MRAWIMTLVLTGTVLAGCNEAPLPVIDDDCEDAVLCDPEQYFGDHFCEKNQVTPRVYAPDTASPGIGANPWKLGDWWEYRLVIDGVDLGTTKLIYYDIQDAGAHYMIGTPTRDEALQHAIFSTNPVIGRIHKTLYSPHESGEHADMFNFPLCQGNSWNAAEAKPEIFFGTPFKFLAARSTIELPDGSKDANAFRISGLGVDDDSRVTHTFSHKAKWFTNIDLDRADGLTVEMDLEKFGTGAKGKAYFLRGQKDEVLSLSGNSGDTTVVREDGRDGPYDTVGIHIDFQRVSGERRVEAVVTDPDDNRVACVGFDGVGALDGGARGSDCHDGDDGPITLEVPYAPGDWTVTYGRVGNFGGQVDMEGELRIVSIYDRSDSI